MPDYLTAVAKATSTVCVILSAYILVRKRYRSTSSANLMASNGVDACGGPSNPCKRRAMSNPEMGFNVYSPSPSSSNGVVKSVLSSSWRSLSGMVASPSSAGCAQLASSSTIDLGQCASLSDLQLPEELLNHFFAAIQQLAQQSGLCPKIQRAFQPRRGFSFLSTRRDGGIRKFEAILDALISYTKNEQFINLFSTSPELPTMMELVWVVSTLSMTSLRNSNDPPTRGLHRSAFVSAAASIDNLESDQLRILTDDPSLADSQSHDPVSFRLSFKTSTVLANLSANKLASVMLTSSPVIEQLLSFWITSPSLRLKLTSEKIKHNLKVHLRSHNHQRLDSAAAGRRRRGKEEEEEEPIYHNSIFRMDDVSHNAVHDDNIGYDIIFVNGMLGSVFYTWRSECAVTCSLPSQSSDPHHYTKSWPRLSDAYNTKCWPRDWLGREFPNCRILGVDTSLKPFLWNSLCPVDQSRRQLKERAQELLDQLRAAGVGRRPIVWITHSAGGVLVKEVIRLATSVSLDESEGHGPSSIKNLQRVESYSRIADRTKAVVFQSAPHRGTTSMLALYYWPIRWMLTPEALPFEHGSPYILDLHNWFEAWSSQTNLKVMSMVETRLTKIARFLSFIIVPENAEDHEMGKLVRIDADHLYISKPNTPSDTSYTCIVDFLHELYDSKAVPSSSSSPTVVIPSSSSSAPDSDSAIMSTSL